MADIPLLRHNGRVASAIPVLTHTIDGHVQPGLCKVKNEGTGPLTVLVEVSAAAAAVLTLRQSDRCFVIEATKSHTIAYEVNTHRDALKKLHRGDRLEIILKFECPTGRAWVTVVLRTEDGTKWSPSPARDDSLKKKKRK